MPDGDDYWTDEGKLQHQVDLLEARPGQPCVGRDVRYFYQDTASFGDKSDVESIARLLGDRVANADEIDLQQWRLFQFTPQTCTLCFRASALAKLPDWFRDLTAADNSIVMLLAAHGPVCFHRRVMSVSRIHPASELQLTHRFPRCEWFDWHLAHHDILRMQRAWRDRSWKNAAVHLLRASARDPIGLASSAVRYGIRKATTRANRCGGTSRSPATAGHQRDSTNWNGDLFSAQALGVGADDAQPQIEGTDDDWNCGRRNRGIGRGGGDDGGSGNGDDPRRLQQSRRLAVG